MSRDRDWNDLFDEVEAMVQAAGDYVGASDDLRPRVLESARMRCGEQRARRRLCRVAFTVVFLSVFTAAADRRSEMAPRGPELALAAIDSRALYAQAKVEAADEGDFGWGMVDALRLGM
jgi:hypothetical protein